MIPITENRRTVPVEVAAHPLQSEHAALASCAERLERLLGMLAAGSPEAGEGGDVLLLLDDFRRRLFAHFSVEERDGVLDRAAALEPRFAGRIDGLRHEHGELRGMADRLVADADGAEWVYVYTRFVAFVRVLRVHERAENRVLHGAYVEDLGGRG